MMDDEQKKTQLPPTSPEPETEPETEPEVEENVEEEQVDTQPSSEADVKKEETGDEQTDTSDSKWENEKKSMAGKISKLEKEANEYRQAKQLLDALNTAAANDPDFMKIANKKLVEQGVLDESVLQELEKTTPQTTSDGVVSNPAIEWAQAKMKEEQDKKEAFFNSFEENKPDLTEGDPELVRAKRQGVAAAAAIRMKQGESMEVAYENAYKQIFHPEKLVEEGELSGIAKAQSASPVEGAASGTSAKSSGKADLTPEQKEAARLFGLTEEEYAEGLEE